jgi:ankyrin repeat protein
MWGDINKKLLRACQDQKPDKQRRVKDLLDQGADINAAEKKQDRYRGMTPLLFAIMHKDEALARYLIERGANIHHKDNDREDAFSFACGRRMTGIIDLLLEKGADINQIGRWDKTALMNACYNGHADMVDFLIERKADINLKGSYGYTPLHWAVSNGHMHIVQRLIKEGADIDAASNDGTTPLMRAVGNTANYELIRLFLEHKASTSLRNDSGQTAYEIAKRNNNQKILCLFAEHQQNGDEGIKWEKVSNTAVKRDSIIDEQFTRLEHLDFQTRMYVTIIKDSSGKFSHASQPFNSVARATVEDAAHFLRRNGGTPDPGKQSSSSRKPGKRDI